MAGTKDEGFFATNGGMNFLDSEVKREVREREVRGKKGRSKREVTPMTGDKTMYDVAVNGTFYCLSEIPKVMINWFVSSGNEFANKGLSIG